MNTILGRKKEMTQIFDKNGKVIPVTIIESVDCKVVGSKTMEKDGYSALKLGLGVKKNPTMPEAGKYKGMKIPAVVREVKTDETMELGTKVSVDIFAVGDKVKLTGTTKGTGFTGVIKMWGFHGNGDRTRGQSNTPRHIGSIGASTPGRVMKGRRMAGRGGNQVKSYKNIEIVFVDPKTNLIGVRGAVPGKKNALVVLSKLSKKVL